MRTVHEIFPVPPSMSTLSTICSLVAGTMDPGCPSFFITLTVVQPLSSSHCGSWTCRTGTGKELECVCSWCVRCASGRRGGGWGHKLLVKKLMPKLSVLSVSKQFGNGKKKTDA